jgi:hypothetical protein
MNSSDETPVISRPNCRTAERLRWISVMVALVACGGDDDPPATGNSTSGAGTGAGAVSEGGAGASVPAAGAMALGRAGMGMPAAGARAQAGGTGNGAAGAGTPANVPMAGAGGAAGSGMPPAMGGMGASGMAAGGMGASGMAAAGAGGATDMPACTKGAVKAGEVVFIGESFIAQTGAIPRMTSELARKAGTIGTSESYRSLAVSGTQLTTSAIPMQYQNAKRGGSVKVVLMDGGGNDLLLGGRCTMGYDAGCKEIVDVVQELFATFEMDGVKDVVYFFYPDPMGIGARIKEPMDILRPEMKKACDESTGVRCVWVDQRETWEGNYDRFTSDGIHPTEAGSMASAQQIWDAMVEHCIAQ